MIPTILTIAGSDSTGCSLSAAIVARLAKQKRLQWLHGAIAAASQLEIGKGPGPVHHLHGPRQ